MKKRSLRIAVLCFLLLTAVSLSAVIMTKSREPKRISFYHSFSETQLTALSSVIEQFEIENDGITVELHYLKHVDLNKAIQNGDIQPDLFCWFGPVAKGFPFESSTPRRWMGEGWSLAVNRSIVADNIFNLIKRAESIEEFDAVLEQLRTENITPLSVGNSHLWPLNSWSQHILISGRTVDDNYIPLKDDKEYLDSWEVIRRWKQKRYFLEETWNEGWPSGVAAMSRGESAMTLLSDKMLTAISPETRSKIEFLPFPQGHQRSWLIGSGTSLVINEESKAAPDALQLQKFLTAPEVTDYLTFQLRRFFYSSEDDAYSRHVASWQELANDPEMRDYGTELLKYVESPE